MDEIQLLKQIIGQSNNIVFFGGAGVSTESGIKDFRSVDGIYSQTYDYPPEEILSHDFFFLHTEAFYKFYRDKMIAKDVLPNFCHKALTTLEKEGKLKAVITQNIDGLHGIAGTKTVYELHGTIYKNRCVKCNKFYDLDHILSTTKVPKCSCGGIIKPEVVLYGEALNEQVLTSSIQAIKNADLLIVAGTSLTVYPAAGLLRYFKGKNLVLINKDQTDYDFMANIVIHDKVGQVFSKIMS